MDKIFRLGIDIGSTTAKFALIDDKDNLVLSEYLRHNTKITETVSELLSKIKEKYGDIGLKVKFTGSAGMGISERTQMPFIQEVVAATEIVKKKYPKVSTLIDIGGEDSKMIFFHDQKTPDIRMNGSCAGGTGAFIDQIASLMNINVSEFNELAKNHKNIYSIASRCGVFAKTDVQNLISRKIGREDIAASVFHAVAIQAMNTLARGFDISAKVMFVGGPFTFFPELRKTFVKDLKITDNDVIIPEHPAIIPALGAAFSLNGVNKSFQISDIQTKIKTTSNTNFTLKNRLPALFDSKKELDSWQNNKVKTVINKIDIKNYKGKELFLGIDSGSTTTKIAIIGENNELLFKFYGNNKGNPIDAVKEGLIAFFEELGELNFKISYSAVTGYGEDLTKSAFGLDIGLVETIAHFTAAQYFNKKVSFIMDIGGQDMKAIFVENGVVNRLELNESCSSGCGSFIETFGQSLGFEVRDFAKIACDAKHPYDLGTRCTVFMNSKVKQALKENASVNDISAGLSVSVIKNALYKVLNLSDINEMGENIVVQGGSFKNPAVHKALENHIGKKVTISNIPELMGAFGAALVAKKEFKNNKKTNFISSSKLNEINNFTTKELTCKACENFCLVNRFTFPNKKVYYSGNKCEKVFSNKGEKYRKGENLFDFKNDLLFNRKKIEINSKSTTSKVLTIGLPRVLNFYENYPFWHTLFTQCGINVELSAPSTMKLFETGSGSVMSDNICFPAKLAHGHILNLAEKKVERIFYPMVFYEKNTFKNSENTFNCPIVAAYPEVVKSAINPLEKYGIPVDAPTINFDNEKLLRKSMFDYLKQFGIKKQNYNNAFDNAIIEQDNFSISLKERANELILNAKKNNTLLIVLAGRPYHADPLINHKTPHILTDLGVDVITEDALPSSLTINELQVISQWTYPNRILNAAEWVSLQEANIQFVQLNSFGCGPDAILIDECKDILKAKGKAHTVIRVDEITSNGSIRLRIRSLIESLKLRSNVSMAAPKERKSVKTYELEDRKRTIIAPYFGEIYGDFVPALFKAAGYNVLTLPKPDKKSVEFGLKYSNNEICYPATIVVGDIIKAVTEGGFDRNEIAVGITQTGGQCRATTYLSLINKALITAGYDDIPIVSVGTSGKTVNSQPGFKINWLKLLPLTLAGMLFADSLVKLYFAIISKEKNKGDTDKVRIKYTDLANKLLVNKKVGEIFDLLKNMVDDFNKIEIIDKEIGKIAIVGEIYVKYNSFGHHKISQWLIKQGVEVVFPPLLEFFTQEFVNIKVNQKAGLTDKKFTTNMLVYLFEKYANRYISRTNKILKKFRFHCHFHDVKHIAAKAEEILSLTNQFGEGWLIPAEIAGFSEDGIHNVISVQPFGCIANQIVSKGVEKKIKDLYPNMNLLFLDFDDGASDVNILNRLHFLINNFEK